jgi:hypothetical protein
MPPAKQTDNVVWPVHDYGKQVADIPPKHAHIKRPRVGKRGEFATKFDSSPGFAQQHNLSLDKHGAGHAADTSKWMSRACWLKLQGSENVRAEYSPIGANVGEENHLHPSAIRRSNLTANDRSSDSVITDVPEATD